MSLTKRGTPRKREPRTGEGRPVAGTTQLSVRISIGAETHARAAAAAAGLSLGQWVSRTILDTGAAQIPALPECPGH